MRRLLIVLAVVVLLALGVLAAIAIYRLHGEGNIRGSSPEEFTPSTIAAKPPPPPLGIEWPMYGFDATRDRAVQLALRPPFRRVWSFGAGSLIEFPPSIGLGRLYFSTNSGTLAAVNMKTGKRAWKYFSGRCVAASPAVGPSKHGTVYAVFLNKPPCNARHSKGTGKVIAFEAGFGKIRWQKTIAPSESSPLSSATAYVGDWDGRVWRSTRAPGGRSGAGARARADQGRDRVRRGRLYVGAYDGHVYCLGAGRPPDLEGVGAGRRSTEVALLLDAGDRLRARVHRLDRRQGLFVRRVERQASLVARDGRLRVRIARGVERARPDRLVQQAVLCAGRRDGG
jgi:hypothetical protein